MINWEKSRHHGTPTEKMGAMSHEHYIGKCATKLCAILMLQCTVLFENGYFACFLVICSFFRIVQDTILNAVPDISNTAIKIL